MTQNPTPTPPPPATTKIKNLFNAVKRGLNHRMDAAVVVKEFEWHTKALKVKEITMPLTTLVVFAWIKKEAHTSRYSTPLPSSEGTHSAPQSTKGIS